MVSIKYWNLHYFKEVLILLCQSVFETRKITHLHGLADFTIPLNACKLDWEENIFDIYAESIAFKIKILSNVTLF